VGELDSDINYYSVIENVATFLIPISIFVKIPWDICVVYGFAMELQVHYKFKSIRIFLEVQRHDGMIFYQD
jgi:hypothetical protein